ncbi:MAG: hypothetical protein KA275_04815 [Chitinophagaceae bacterium]|nr:hypothetical protein [Chitinophagaceae bacterium]
MKIELNKIPSDFNADSKVWIFQSNRNHTEIECEEINMQLHNFYSQWQSHGKDVKGWAEILFQRFVVVIADENISDVSGCSTDGMTRIIKSFENQYAVNFFDRLMLSFYIKEKVETLPLNQVKYALENGILKTDTLFFNHLVDNKQKLETEWLVPLDKSWLWQRIIN